MNTKNKRILYILLIFILIFLIIAFFYISFTGDVINEDNNYEIKITSLSNTQSLGKGAVIVHSPQITFDFNGGFLPVKMEKLVEIGNPVEYIESIKNQEGVNSVYVNEVIEKNQEKNIFVSGKKGDYVSLLFMILGTNDGYVYAELPLIKGESKIAVNYDAGTEENTKLNSGFKGGQPDFSKGKDNIENGIATQPKENVKFHNQLKDPIMKVSIY